MQLGNTSEATVSHRQNVRVYAGFGVFEHPEIVRSAIADGGTDDTSAAAVHDNLRFQRMTLALAGVIFFLFFLGRSIGLSPVSMSAVFTVLAVNSAPLPGKLNCPDFISVFSTHIIIFRQFDSLTP